jgi:hypothetical protein
MVMPKTLTHLCAILAAACCAATGTALAQPHRGPVAAAPAPHVAAPAPHVSAPAPHISAPAPRVSAPAPHVSAAPRFSAAPRISAAPHVATPRFSARGPAVHQAAPHAQTFSRRGFGGQAAHGPAATRHELGRFAGRPAARAGHTFAGRNLTRGAARTTGAATRHATGPSNLARAPQRERPFAKVNGRTGGAADLAKGRTPTTAPNARIRDNATQLATVSRPLGERNRNPTDRHRWFDARRHFHRGGFIGWFGPVFWPTAYDDVFDYVFWPVEYDNYGFWAYAYDDVLDNVFFAPGTEDVYASVGGGYAGGGRGGRRAERRHAREAPRGASEICRVDPGLTQWPVDQIAQAVEPTSDQQALLDDLKAASERAAQMLQAACPTTPPATPLGRLDAMAKRLDTMLQALGTVRPALAKFYDSLSDEQKARFNAMGREQTAGGAQGKDEARVCGQSPAGLTAEGLDRIEQDVRPNDRQKGELDALRDAAAKAGERLRAACPDQTPITPVARLDAMHDRVAAMRDAVDTVRPALARFYASLNDEQKAHLNVMSRQQARNQ